MKPLHFAVESTQITAAADDTVDADMLKGFAASLAWHGVNATARLAEADGRPAADALIDAAWEIEADLIVMGAFSHPRLREMILGGVTWHILKVADQPVLMMH